MIRFETQQAMPFPRTAIWPVLSQTDWLNRSLGLPPVRYTLERRPEGGSGVTAQARLLGWLPRFE